MTLIAVVARAREDARLDAKRILIAARNEIRASAGERGEISDEKIISPVKLACA